jgi:UDP-glucose 4-epimerase
MNKKYLPENISQHDDLEYILVTGAAGYIGSVVTEQLVKQGENIIALDNLSKGHRASISEGVLFFKGDINDAGLLDRIFRDFPIKAVVHLAADTLVGESVLNPGKYFRNNVIAGLNLLNTMCKYSVNKIVFSSSCAVYGQAQGSRIDESVAKLPINPYGEAKLIFEKFLYWYFKAYGLSSVSLRYFNAAGASERFGEHHVPETHLIPNVIKVALGQAEFISVFGNNYPTDDGSCVRDYVHVIDIARAHVLALRQLGTEPLCQAYNLGNGTGYSVMRVINEVSRISGVKIPVVLAEPRPGDPPVLVADSTLVMTKLGWEPQYTGLESIIESAYGWMKAHPYGYYDAEKTGDLFETAESHIAVGNLPFRNVNDFDK